jgi:hypothetical protein
MEKLNKYLPHIIIVCGAMITILSVFFMKSTLKAVLGLVFMGFGFFNLYYKNKSN